jgi:hypothetical protein
MPFWLPGRDYPFQVLRTDRRPADARALAHTPHFGLGTTPSRCLGYGIAVLETVLGGCYII